MLNIVWNNWKLYYGLIWMMWNENVMIHRVGILLCVMMSEVYWHHSWSKTILTQLILDSYRKIRESWRILLYVCRFGTRLNLTDIGFTLSYYLVGDVAAQPWYSCCPWEVWVSYDRCIFVCERAMMTFVDMIFFRHWWLSVGVAKRANPTRFGLARQKRVGPSWSTSNKRAGSCNSFRLRVGWLAYFLFLIFFNFF